MASSRSLDLARAYPTMIGSVLSCIGSGFILFCYSLLPAKRHFRHALIINLAISDFVNSLNNSVSGIYIIWNDKDLSDGRACTANAFIGQLSVQGTDCSIFIIALVTLLSLTRKEVLIKDNALLSKSLACGSAWILPLITSFTALGLGLYHPVSGNWCWIQEHPTYLRYVLTHMWRFLSIFLSAGIYIYIYFWVHRHFREIKMLGSNGYRGHSGDPDAEGGLEDNILEFSDTIALKSAAAPLNSEAASTTSHTGVNVAKSITRNEDSTQNRGRSYSVGGNPLPTEAFVKRTLLLNAYPIMYIFLWIPGIANRIAEATDHPSRALTIMQATTQYVGLANAITYGLNEKVLRQLQAYIFKE